jgi:hypothetical protein
MKKLDKNPLKNLETNAFGGKNPHGLYVPMTDIEMEALARLIEENAFRVEIKDWGYVENFKRGIGFKPELWDGSPTVVFGDKRVSFYFLMNFSAPLVPQPNWYFDMEVWAKGKKLFGPQRYPTTNAGNPISIVAGMQLGLALDVAIDQIDPAFIKEVMPGVIGLTTRQGNMRLDTEKARLLSDLQKNEATVRSAIKKDAIFATKKAKGEV